MYDGSGEDEKRLSHGEHHYMEFINAINIRTRPVVDVEMGHRSDSVCSPGNIGYQLGYSDPDIYAVGISALYIRNTYCERQGCYCVPDCSPPNSIR